MGGRFVVRQVCPDHLRAGCDTAIVGGDPVQAGRSQDQALLPRYFGDRVVSREPRSPMVSSTVVTVERVSAVVNKLPLRVARLFIKMELLWHLNKARFRRAACYERF